MCGGCFPDLERYAHIYHSRITADPSFEQAQRDLVSRSIPATRPRPEQTTLFTNGTILTLANHALSPVDYLVVDTSGVITYAGDDLSTAQAAAGPTSSYLTHDLKGATVLPGFIEPHVHLALTALANGYLLDLSPLAQPTLQDVTTAIYNNALNPEHNWKGWVLGFGYDPSRLPNDYPDLTVDILDPISDGLPVFVLNSSGHIAYVNNVAFDVVINESAPTPNPITREMMETDNHFLKDSNGKLSGVLLDSAIALISPYIPGPPHDTLGGLANAVLNDWFSMGVTTIFDAGIGATPIDALVYPRLQPTPMRLRAAVVPSPKVTPDTRSSWNLGHQVTAKAVKFWVDGSTQGFTAMLNKPYPNPPPWLNKTPPTPPYANSTELQNAMQPWYDKGYQLAVHSNGDKGTDLVLEAYQNLFKKPPANPDPDVIPTPPFHRIEHVTVVSDEQIHAIATTGKLSVSHTIGHVYYWGEAFTNYIFYQGASLPPDPRPPRIDPLASDIANGLLWSLHSDSPVTPVTPLLYVRTALTRLTQQNSTLLGGAQRVTDLAAAIKGITINPAIQLGLFNLPSQGGDGGGEGQVDAMNAKGDQGGDGIEEPAIGSLEVGKQADFVVLGSDPRSVDWTVLDEIPSVKETWIGGVQVFPSIFA